MIPVPDRPDGSGAGAVDLHAGLTVTTGDGVHLHTDVVRPAGGSRHPVVLLRTPYGTASHLREAVGWASRGWVAVLQDVRGRFSSTGRWDPWSGTEGSDGLNTLRWITDQPWCDGRVIAYGGSYAAHCAVELATAATGPAGSADDSRCLVGVVAAVPALSTAHTITEPSGVPRLLAHAWFWPSHGDTALPRGPVLDALLAVDPDLLRHLPVADLPARLGVDLPSFAGRWSASRPDPLLPPRRAGAALPPLLCVGGQFDAYADAAVELWRAWPTPDATLVFGAWSHDLGLAGRPRNGDLPVATGHRVPVGRFVAGWAESVLAGRPGRDRRWLAAVQGSDDWCWGGGDLAGAPVELPTAEPADGWFVSDPDVPHPAALGPVDVTTASARPDCVVVETSPLPGDLTLLGAPRVELSGLAAATLAGRPVGGGTALDWAVRLAAVAPDGRSVQLGHAAARTAAPGVVVDLPPVAHRITAGHRLAVGVSGHLFPVHPRDPQDGSDPLTAVTLRPVRRHVGRVRLTVPRSDPGSDHWTGSGSARGTATEAIGALT